MRERSVPAQLRPVRPSIIGCLPGSLAPPPQFWGTLPDFSAIITGVSPHFARRSAMIRKIQHIGVAVKSLSDAIPFYRDVLGLELLGIEEVAEQKVRTAVFRGGAGTIEVLETTWPDGPVGKVLEKNGEGIHHLCLRVDDAAGALAHAKGKGVRLADEQPRAGVPGRKQE